MGIEAIPHKGGAGRARIICDDCGKDDCVPCAYVGPNNSKSDQNRPKESQARAKAISLGWSYVKNKMRCPTCEAKRKVVPMKQEPKKETSREPTQRQRIEIFTMLAECYDIDAGRYQQGDTDDTVAEVLGVMPGWVAEIREAEFGPDGGNEDIERLAGKIADMLKKIEGIKGDCEAIRKDANSIIKCADVAMQSAEKKLAEVSAMKADLERIKKAVGPRVQRVAGVK